ncbi:MAG: YebC/PmpR family DNA-binding transcriptional regulator [Bacteroidetes bacterium]|nr:YebC/PmpR family DNA-binding transcriptional regulator [Bacteroidota bacterium]
MSGHSKWANIKHRKGTQDKRKSKLFTRILKDIVIAVKNGGANPEGNPYLRLALQNARGANIPKDKIENAIKKTLGKDGENYQELTYEGYGNGGVAVFIETATDSPKRTVANIRSIFLKSGGNLGTNGSLNHIFVQKGVFLIPLKSIESKEQEDTEIELIDAGAEEIEKNENHLEITTTFENFGVMQKKLDELGIEAKNASLQRICLHTKTLPITEALKFLKMIEKLEDDEDINAVYHNLELTDELKKELEK